ncbi:MAG: hypothetical protein EXX96DRAFT_560055 [Benjaminiella poitrasii]|nr:MAG: hypothetical protein EXX96DRAFT_560055 [Benjaminiella poitrasii]
MISQAYVYCFLFYFIFSKLIHPHASITVDGRAVKREVKSVFVCRHTNCVSVKHSTAIKSWDAFSAIGLSGLSYALFGQTFTMFATSIISQSNTDQFINLTAALLSA